MGTALFLATVTILVSACGAGSSAHCDWASFVKHDGITYHSLEEAVEPRAIDQKVGEVLHEVQSDECERELRDGDAAHLKVGSDIFSLRRWETSFRLGLETEEGTTLYQVWRNDKAVEGGDLLQIDGRVEWIRVVEPAWVAGRPRGRTVLGLVEESRTLDKLVQNILTAPIDYERFPPEDNGASEAQLELAIRLSDGTTLQHRYWPGFSGRIDPGIFLPEEFRRTLAGALGAGGERLYEIKGDAGNRG